MVVPPIATTVVWAAAKRDVKNPTKAVTLAEKVCEITEYKEPESLDTLAAAYAAAGRFNKAVDIAGKALELCQSPTQNTLKKEIEGRLNLYKSNKAYVESY